MNTDITDMIIDFLHDDTYTLKRCSRVCRSWLPATRFHLFRSINLYAHSPRYHRSHRPHYCNNLLTLIQRNPYIATLIRELYIREGQEFRKQDWVNETQGLPLLLTSLPNLNKLHLRRVDWILLTPKLREAFRSVFSQSSITDIDIELCRFPFTSFVRLVSTCQSLKSMTLRETTFRYMHEEYPEKSDVVDKEEATVGYPGQNTSQVGRKCQLRDLRIINCPSEVISWLTDPNGAVDLSQLCVLHCHAWSNTIKTLLGLASGGSVQHLLLMAPDLNPCTWADHPLGIFTTVYADMSIPSYFRKRTARSS
jgi:hypothetical protein